MRVVGGEGRRARRDDCGALGTGEGVGGSKGAEWGCGGSWWVEGT